MVRAPRARRRMPTKAAPRLEFLEATEGDDEVEDEEKQIPGEELPEEEPEAECNGLREDASNHVNGLREDAPNHVNGLREGAPNHVNGLREDANQPMSMASERTPPTIERQTLAYSIGTPKDASDDRVATYLLPVPVEELGRCHRR